MDIQEFKNLHNSKSVNLKIFNSPEAREFASAERRVTSKEIEDVEESIGYKLLLSYKEFCKNYGGGYFGYALVLSLDIDGEWFLGNVIDQFPNYISAGFVPFADDQIGGYFCFKIQGNEAIDNIHYLNSSGASEDTEYLDFFDFLIKTAYSA